MMGVESAHAPAVVPLKPLPISVSHASMMPSNVVGSRGRPCSSAAFPVKLDHDKVIRILTPIDLGLQPKHLIFRTTRSKESCRGASATTPEEVFIAPFSLPTAIPRFYYKFQQPIELSAEDLKTDGRCQDIYLQVIVLSAFEL